MYPEVNRFGIAELDRALKRIARIDEKRARVVSAYFDDMKTCLERYHEALRKDGVCSLVIGPSRIRKILVPTHAILRRLAEKTGFKFVESFERTIDPARKQTANAPNEYGGGAINEEHILVLRK